MTWIALIMLLAVIQYVVFTSLVGSGRAKYGVDAPKTSGHELWERRYRVQQNTLEQIVAFLPSLYFCATYANLTLALVGGIVYLLGRTQYAIGYYKDPSLRGPGMLMTFFSTAIMAAAALIGIIWSLLE